MDRLVHYSLSLSEADPRPDLVVQLDASARTLRAHNASIAVGVFVYGSLTPALAAVCAAHDLRVHLQGSYARRLQALCPHGAPALARYPLLHRFLNFRQLAATGASQILYCDCDTLFFDDVERLFDSYAAAHVVAREEVHSSRSAHGVDAEFIDEALLTRLALELGAVPIPPINLGLVLLNHGVWHALAALEGRFVDLAWRLATWMAANPVQGQAATYGEFLGAEEARAHAGPADRARALPYPSVNRWIMDEVALWLTLGHVRGIRTADFHPRDVAANGELAAGDPATAGWIACHYYSQNMHRVAAWLGGDRAPVPG